MPLRGPRSSCLCSPQGDCTHTAVRGSSRPGVGTGKAEGVRLVGKAGDGGWGRRQGREKEEGEGGAGTFLHSGGSLPVANV